MEIIKLCEKLQEQGNLTKEEFLFILENITPQEQEVISCIAREITEKRFNKQIYTRGLIEISSYCKNDCYYCGLRRSNKKATRYRLTKEQILESAEIGKRQGFSTFVLQGGEDPYFTDEILCDIIENLKKNYPDCAVTLSLGERSYESYKKLKIAGADRYLLRQESIDKRHYGMLHPENMTIDTREQCLKDLKELEYQVGTGIMVGSPYQTNENIADDLCFIANFRPQMVGIGPFLPHKDTPFANQDKGNLEKTLLLLSLLRIIDKDLLLPATTALATLHIDGRKRGILAGANVIMPNVSPEDVRKNYMLYNNKVSFGEELLERDLTMLGYDLCHERGDYKRRV